MNSKKTPEELKKEWEEAMLEPHSYYDVDIIVEHNAPILEEIEYWKNRVPSSNMGKWWNSVKIESLKKKLKHYE
jgi:hypothetical protein